MKKVYKAIIVGGGASGLACATKLCMLGISGKDILILEKNDRIGKKLLATGNGQGNLSNAKILHSNYYGDSNFISQYVYSMDKPNIEDFFLSLNLPIITDEEGRKYPLSKQASSILDVFRFFLNNSQVNIATNENVISTEKVNGTFSVITKTQTYFGENLVLAVGGSAGKRFGTDGSSYSLAKKYSHKLSNLFPSLVQLKTNKNAIRGLKGLKEHAVVSAFVNGKFVKKVDGDILFTDYGVSGDTIFKLSAILSNAVNPSICIEFAPEFSTQEISNIIDERLKQNFLPKEEILTGIVNKRIGQAVIKDALLNGKILAEKIKNFSLNIEGTLGFDYAQVTKGGIITDNIFPLTFESKLEKDLYILGEMLNVDGDCGGYNLDFAFSSGILSAMAICKK